MERRKPAHNGTLIKTNTLGDKANWMIKVLLHNACCSGTCHIVSCAHSGGICAQTTNPLSSQAYQSDSPHLREPRSQDVDEYGRIGFAPSSPGLEEA
jgi:hypothetical protein